MTNIKANTIKLTDDVKGIEAEVQARYGKIKRDIKLVVKAPPRELDLLLVATAPEAEKLKRLELKVNNKVKTSEIKH